MALFNIQEITKDKDIGLANKTNELVNQLNSLQINEGTEKGSIAVTTINGTKNIKIHGLGDIIYENKEDYKIQISEGTEKGTIAVTTKDGTENVKVHGLGSIAYEEKENFSPKNTGFYSVNTIEQRNIIQNAIEGSTCYVKETRKTYRYEEDDETFMWKEFNGNGVISSVPSLSYNYQESDYNDKLYYDETSNTVFIRTNLNEKIQVPITFTSINYGNCKIHIYKDGVEYQTISHTKGNMFIDLGKMTTEGTAIYTITAEDYLTVPAPEMLKFTIIVGSLRLESTFDKYLEENVIDINKVITISYTAKSADISSKIHIEAEIFDSNNMKVGRTYETDDSTASYFLESKFNIDPISTKGNYTLKLTAYTLDKMSNAELKYSFVVLEENGIGISCLLNESEEITTYTSLNIPFQAVSANENDSILLVQGQLYYINDSGQETEITASSPGYDQVSSTLGDTSVYVSTKVKQIGYWFIGKLSKAGRYKYKLRADNIDHGKQSDVIQGYFKVTQYAQTLVEPIQTNLIAWFDANYKMSNSISRPDVWINRASSGNKYYIQLTDLNYNTNGWIEDETATGTNRQMLKFTGDSYGTMMTINEGEVSEYKPFEQLTNDKLGFTIETLIRTRCVGELKARVLNAQKVTYIDGNPIYGPGVSISHNEIIVKSSNNTSTMNFSENEWTHVAFVINRDTINLTYEKLGLANIQNLNIRASMSIYINGVMCAHTLIDGDGETFLNDPTTLTLNMFTDSDGNQYFGQSEIKFLRIYDSYLTSDQVVNNYISTFGTAEEQKLCSNRNEEGVIPTIVFRRMGNGTDFAEMNKITNKAISSNTSVKCNVEITHKGKTSVWTDAKVSLQGTSSLVYPVKNYKIKLPATTDVFADTGIEFTKDWIKEKTFTIKCDYMDSSHLNNTATASMFEDVLDQVIENESESSFARQNRKKGYHDGVHGFPCILYYIDDEAQGAQYLGTYMFNKDKKAEALGLKLKHPTGEFEQNEDGSFKLDENGNKIEIMAKTCQSFEGATNDNTSAGAFVSYSDFLDITRKAEIATLDKNYNDYVANGSHISKTEYVKLKYGGITSLDDVEGFKKWYETENNLDEYKYIEKSFEVRYDYLGFDDLEINDNSTEEEIAAYNQARAATYSNWKKTLDWVSNCYDKYLQKSSDTTFKDEFDKHFLFKYCLTYYLQMMVFGQVDNPGKNSMWDSWDGKIWCPRPYDMDSQVGLNNTGDEIIRTDCEINRMTSPYYSRFTTGDYSTTPEVDVLRYTYNTSESRFWKLFAIQFKDEICNYYKSLRRTVYNLDYIIPKYKSYTIDQIGEKYYNKDMAIKYINHIGTDIRWLTMLHGNRLQKFKFWLNERFIFLDAYFKYYYDAITSPDSLNGKISGRIDAYLTVPDSDKGTALTKYIGISSYTPQYVTLYVATGDDAYITAYVGPDSYYYDPYTNEKTNGTLFKFPIIAADKEFIIYGAGNINQMHMLDDLNIREISLGEAFKITNIDLNGSTRLTKLSLDKNTYLNDINLSNCQLLGTDAQTQTLDCSKCINLKRINISNTKLKTLVLPKGSNLQDIDVSSSTITELSLINQEFLRQINMANAKNMMVFRMEQCPKYDNLSLAGLNINEFHLLNCKSINSINMSECQNLEVFDVQKCENVHTLNLSKNNSRIMNNLNLSDYYNLENLNVSNSTTLQVLILPKYASQTITDMVAGGKMSPDTAEKWNKLTTFTCNNATGFYAIKYGTSDSSTVVNMKQITKPTYLYFYGCSNIKEISNLSYYPTGSNINYLFGNCTKLKSVSGIIDLINSSSSTNTNATNVFNNCIVLDNIASLQLKNFTRVSSIGGMFAWCHKISFVSVRDYVLKKCGTNLKAIDSLFSCKSVNVADITDNSTIPDDMFATTPNITNINSAFYKCSIKKLSKTPLQYFKNVTTASYGFYGNGLNTVDSDVMTYFVNLENASAMFGGNSSCTSTLTDEFLKTCTKLTSVEGMFVYDTNIKFNKLDSLLNYSPNITSTKYMFYGCSSINCSVPTGFFANCKRLAEISATFMNCSKLTDLPSEGKSLFRKTNDTTSNMTANNLYAYSLFSGCSGLNCVISSNLFAGAGNIIAIGSIPNTSSYRLPDSTSYPAAYGFFHNCSKIYGYYDTFLQKIPLVTDISGLFRGCSNLEHCYYYNGSTQKEYANTLKYSLFEKNSKIQNINYAFYDCAKLVGCIPFKLENNNYVSFFNAFKQSLTYANYTFAMTNANTNTKFNGEDKETGDIVGLPKNIFKNFKALTTISGFLRCASNYTIINIPEDLFEGCINLQNTSYMFSYCYSLRGSSEPLSNKLFNSCRNTLTNTSYMFEKCSNFDFKLSKGAYLNSSDENGQLITTTLQPGLLADCVKLATTKAMFAGCILMKGSIPEDIFATSSISSYFTVLNDVSYMFADTRSLNDAYANTDSNGNTTYYVIPPTLFNKTPNIKYMQYAFAGIYSNGNISYSLKLDNSSFNKCTALENTSRMFYWCRKLKPAITKELFKNSLNTLKYINCMFTMTTPESVTEDFLINPVTKTNTILQEAIDLFYYSSGAAKDDGTDMSGNIVTGTVNPITGKAPKFWNAKVFTALTAAGKKGVIYNCRNLSNYNEAVESNSGVHIRNSEHYNYSY